MLSRVTKKSEIQNSKPNKSNVADMKGDGRRQKKWYRRHPNVMEGRMECWFDLERHLDAKIIGLQVAMYIIGPVLKKIVTNSRTGKTGKLSTVVPYWSWGIRDVRTICKKEYSIKLKTNG